MNAWHTSTAYKVWVVGGLVAIVAFAVIRGMANPADQSLIFWLIPMLAVYMGGIFFMQYRQVNREVESDPETNAPVAGPVKGNIVFGVVLCICIFIGVALLYAGVDETLYPLGSSGPGLPLVLIPAVAIVLVGAARASAVLRSLGRGEYPASGDELQGPVDIPDRSARRD